MSAAATDGVAPGLPLGIEPCFIPVKEPWRNGLVEKFHDHWEQEFLNQIVMKNKEDLARESLSFPRQAKYTAMAVNDVLALEK